VALNEEELTLLREMRDALSEFEVDAQWMDGGEVTRYEPSLTDRALAGLLVPSQGFVAVPPLVTALVQAARLQGAQFESPVEIVRVEPREGGVIVHADG